jgi:hypothetical protein
LGKPVKNFKAPADHGECSDKLKTLSWTCCPLCCSKCPPSMDILYAAAPQAMETFRLFTVCSHSVYTDCF